MYLEDKNNEEEYTEEKYNKYYEEDNYEEYEEDYYDRDDDDDYDEYYDEEYDEDIFELFGIKETIDKIIKIDNEKKALKIESKESKKGIYSRIYSEDENVDLVLKGNNDNFYVEDNINNELYIQVKKQINEVGSLINVIIIKDDENNEVIGKYYTYILLKTPNVEYLELVKKYEKINGNVYSLINTNINDGNMKNLKDHITKINPEDYTEKIIEELKKNPDYIWEDLYDKSEEMEYNLSEEEIEEIDEIIYKKYILKFDDFEIQGREKSDMVKDAISDTLDINEIKEEMEEDFNKCSEIINKYIRKKDEPSLENR